MARIKQTNKSAQRRKKLRQHRRSMTLITCTILLMSLLMGIEGIKFRKQNRQYLHEKQELAGQIKEEKERSKEIDSLKQYVGTKAYIEEIAREKLGLVYPDELILESDNK